MPPTPASLRLAEDTLAVERAAFARRTLFHLAAALAALVALEAVFISISYPQTILLHYFGSAGWRWALFLGVSILLGWLAHAWGRTSDSRLLPYLGLCLSLLLEACVLLPLLLLARHFDAQAPLAALLATAGLIAGLLGLAWRTRERFTVRATVVWLLGGTLLGCGLALAVAGWTPLVLGACGVVGLFALLLIVGLALLMPQHNPDQSVAATQALLAVAATLVWLGVRKGWQVYLSHE